MSVLLAYGTSNKAVIMSDSRITTKNKNDKIIGFKEDGQKVFKITDNFIIGSVGDTRATNPIKNIDVYRKGSPFEHLQKYTYEELLKYFANRIEITETNHIDYSPYISIGIDSNGNIRMDTFDNQTCDFKPAIPKDDDLYSTIYLPPNVNPDLKNAFSDNLRKVPDNEMEHYCEEIVRAISQVDETVNDKIQKYVITI